MSEPTKEQIEKARELARVALGYSPTLTTGEAQENMAQALAAETAPLHEKIARLEQQTREVNEHEDLSFRLLRPAKSTDFRQLACGTCSGCAEFAISLSDNGQWNLECSGCQESGAVLSEVLAKLR